MDHMIDVITNNGVPFRVVYGQRPYRDGSLSERKVVAFYDRRYNGHTEYGQFVSDYDPDTLLDKKWAVGLMLYGGVKEWCVDATAMGVVYEWLWMIVNGEPKL